MWFCYSYVILRRDHQTTDNILSSVTTKVKGIALTNTSELGEQIWDVADYIIPSQVVCWYDERYRLDGFNCTNEPLTVPTHHINDHREVFGWWIFCMLIHCFVFALLTYKSYLQC